MPEHEETDAPKCSIVGCGKDATCSVRLGPLDFFRCDAHAFMASEGRRRSKPERWGVEDKVVDGESK